MIPAYYINLVECTQCELHGHRHFDSLTSPMLDITKRILLITFSQ